MNEDLPKEPKIGHPNTFRPRNIEECLYAFGAAAGAVAVGADTAPMWRFANEIGDMIRHNRLGRFPHILDENRP